MPTGLPDANDNVVATISRTAETSLASVSAALSPVCTLMGVLTDTLQEAIGFLLTKWLHLRRLAEILTNLGYTIPFPNIANLPHILTIDAQIYAALQRQCPSLKLPAYSTASAEKLRSTVLAAYLALSRGLAIHPWSYLTGLQESYFKLLGQADKIVLAAGLGNGILGCIRNICDGKANADVKAVFDGISIPGGFVKNYGQLLDAQQKSLMSQISMARSELTALIE